MISRVEKDVIAFAERTLQLSLFSLWELVGQLQKAWEEQLMKRSNSLENCLTLLLYFWMFPHGQGLLRSWFPWEVSHLGMQWNLWNAEELGRRPAGIRELLEYFFKDIQVYYFQGQRSTDLEGACPASCSVQEALWSILNMASSRLLLIAFIDRKLTILTHILFQSLKSLPSPELHLPFHKLKLAFW